MSQFTPRELAYLASAGDAGRPRLARLATVGRDGMPHVTPVGWAFDVSSDVIEVRGFELQQTKKFRDVAHTRRAAVVIDDLASIRPWRPRGVEIRGHAEADLTQRPVIRIHPVRIISWGLESESIGDRHARTVAR